VGIILKAPMLSLKYLILISKDGSTGQHKVLVADGGSLVLEVPIYFTVLDMTSRYGFGGERLAKAVREICTAVAASRLSSNQRQKHLGKGSTV